MIKLFQLPRVWGLPSISPPCVRLETWLRMTGIPYEARVMDPVNYPIPKGKIPYIEDNGLIMGDSTLIIDYLRKSRNVDPDAHLTPTERAISTAFSRMLTENTYWTTVLDRYADDSGWAIYRELIRPMITYGAPVEQHEEIIAGFKKNILAGYHGHGLGRHANDEAAQILKEDLVAVSRFLADKPFFFGDKPTSVDATAYGVLANIINVPLDTPTARYGRDLPNLIAYCKRMQDRFFSDLETSA